MLDFGQCSGERLPNSIHSGCILATNPKPCSEWLPAESLRRAAMEKRVRSRYFILSGGLGGLVGLALMEMVFLQSQGVTSRLGKIEWMAIYFGGFGLAVGAALGMTEGIVRRNRGRTLYGLAMG